METPKKAIILVGTNPSVSEWIHKLFTQGAYEEENREKIKLLYEEMEKRILALESKGELEEFNTLVSSSLFAHRVRSARHVGMSIGFLDAYGARSERIEEVLGLKIESLHFEEASRLMLEKPLSYQAQQKKNKRQWKRK